MSGVAPIPGIRPVAPSPTLLDVAGPLPTDQWQAGIASRGVSCHGGHPWAGICPDGDAEKVDPAAIVKPEFWPFTFYVPYACDWSLPDQEAAMAAENLAQLEAVSAWHVSHELWAGTANALEAAVIAGDRDPNPTLISEALDLTVTDAVHPVFGLAALMSEYLACTQAGGGVLHVPPILVPFLVHQGVLSQVGSVLRAPLGFTVSAGPGYPGTGSPGPDGDLAPPGQVWVIVSGPVEYALGEPKVLPEASQRHAERRLNRYELWAERRAIVRFDPCCVFAILVDVPNSAPEAS